jgi:hypothetical protein
MGLTLCRLLYTTYYIFLPYKAENLHTNITLSQYTYLNLGVCTNPCHFRSLYRDTASEKLLKMIFFCIMVACGILCFTPGKQCRAAPYYAILSL